MFACATLLLTLGLCATAAQLRINAGGPEIPAIGWRRDTTLYRSPNSRGNVAATAVTATGNWAPVYQSHTYALSGDLEFKIPVIDGTLSVFLLFAETWSEAVAGTRQFSVSVNGVTIVPTLDVFARANGAFKSVFISANDIAVTGGFVNVKLGRISGKNNPMISGIVISRDDGVDPAALVGNEGLGGPSSSVAPSLNPSASPGPTCTQHSLKMNIGGPAVSGYSADNTGYIEGPSGVTAAGGLSTTPQYLTERYTTAAALTYKIPVPAGTYTVTTYHVESYFSSVGERVFNVLINGEVVRSSLDVYASAGNAKNVAIKLRFNGIVAKDGFITVSYAKVVQNPQVNALSILEECFLPSPSYLHPPSSSPGPAATCVTGRAPGMFMMNVGGPGFPSNKFGAENLDYIHGPRGFVYTSSAAVAVDAGSNTAELYLTQRYTKSEALTYKIPVPAGNYTVTTMHAETYFRSGGAREFNIDINGRRVEYYLDVLFKVGRNRALVLNFPNVASFRGVITISFKRRYENPMVSAIKITGAGADSLAVAGGCSAVITSPVPSVVVPPPSTPCDVGTVVTGKDLDYFSMNVGGPAGASFGADNVNYIVGDRGVRKRNNIPNSLLALSEGIFRSERYTRAAAALTYKIPVPSGNYIVSTYHAETHFNAAGKRVFNIAINGKVVRANLDIFASVGKNKDLTLHFRNITSIDEHITISFTKKVQNPTVNALAIYGPGADHDAVGGFEDGSCFAF